MGKWTERRALEGRAGVAAVHMKGKEDFPKRTSSSSLGYLGIVLPLLCSLLGCKQDTRREQLCDSPKEV